MSRADEYRRELARLADWEPYLQEHSGLPGPRGNLELAQAVAARTWPRRGWAGLERSGSPIGALPWSGMTCG
jgi:hypothetical protein